MKILLSVVLVFINYLFINFTAAADTQNNDLSWQVLYDSTNKLLNLRQYSDAVVIAERTLGQADVEFGKIDSNYSKSLQICFESYYNVGNYDKSFEYLRADSSLCIQLYTVNSFQFVNVLVSLGESYSEISDYPNAELRFKTALEISRKVYQNNDPAYADVLNRTGEFLNSLGKYHESGTLFFEALDKFRKIYNSDNTHIADCLNNVGFNYFSTGRLDSAEQYYLEAVAMARRLYPDGHADLAVKINNLGLLYSRLGRFREVEPLYMEALAMRRKYLGETNPYTLQSISNLAQFYNSQSKYDKAEEMFKEILSLREKYSIGNSPQLANALNNLAILYSNTGRFQEAETLLKESMAMRKKIYTGDHIEIANSMISLGYYYLSMGRYPEASEILDSALTMLKIIYENKDNDAVIKCLNNLASAYSHQNMYEKSEPILKEAMEMCHRFFKEKHIYLAGTINNYAGCLSHNGKYEEALPYLKEAVDMIREIYKSDHIFVATYVNNLGLGYKDLNKMEEAEPYLIESNEMLARLYNWNNDTRLKILSNMGDFYYGWNKLDSAEKYFLDAMNIAKNLIKNTFPFLSEKEKKQFYASISDAINHFYLFAIDRSKENPLILNEMYKIRLATKAILLNNTLKIKQRILNSGDISLVELYNNWRKKREEIAGVNKLFRDEITKRGIDLKHLEDEANSLEKELSLKSEAFAAELDNKEYTWQDIKNTLKVNESSVEIIRLEVPAASGKSKKQSVKDSILYVSMIVNKSTLSHPELVILSNGNEIENNIIISYSKIAERLKMNFIQNIEAEDELSNIYEQCWGNIQIKTSGAKVIYVSPDGVFNKLNINTLTNPLTKNYIIEDFDLRIITNPKDILISLNPSKTTDNRAVLFGNPKFKMDSVDFTSSANISRKITRAGMDISSLDTLTRNGISPLPGTKKEVDNISSILNQKKWKLSVYEGKNALEEFVKSVDSPRVLHIATHGLFMTDNNVTGKERSVNNPLLSSFLLFAGSENYITNTVESDLSEDGILTAYEAMNLNLDKTDLVVLSACETGLGDIQNGEGVYGFQRAFKVAGTKNLIMSLWSVNDEATQSLMSLFYKKWLNGLSTRDAFRQAQIELKKTYPAFYYWGAFVMIGA